MRKVKVILLFIAVSMFLTSTIMASSTDLNPESNLRTEIIKLIDQPTLDVLKGETQVAELRLIINADNEIVVLATGTENTALDNYIKSKLNYKKVKASDIFYFKSYFVKIEFKNP